MKTRRAQNSDLHDLSILFDQYRQFYGQEPDLEGATSFVSERLSRRDSAIFVAVSDVSLVGFAQLYPSFSSVSMKRVYILNDLFVDPSSRNQGVGTLLIQAAVDFGKQQHATRLTLATATTNEGAQALYESLGWKRDDYFIHYNLGLTLSFR